VNGGNLEKRVRILFLGFQAGQRHKPRAKPKTKISDRMTGWAGFFNILLILFILSKKSNFPNLPFSPLRVSQIEDLVFRASGRPKAQAKGKAKNNFF
jgi:hypothetical protein